MIEDAHWIDEVSESMLADFLAVIPQTHSMVLITYRPEYHGALATDPGRPDHCPATAEQCADLNADRRAAGLASFVAGAGRAHRRTGRR